MLEVHKHSFWLILTVILMVASCTADIEQSSESPLINEIEAPLSASAGVNSNTWYETSQVRGYLDDCSATTRIKPGLYTQICLANLDSRGGLSTMQAFAVFTVTGTNSYEPLAQIEMKIDGTDDDRHGSLCPQRTIKSGQSFTCAGKQLYVNRGATAGAYLYTNLVDILVAAIGRPG